MFLQVLNGFGVAFGRVRPGLGLVLAIDADDEAFLSDIYAAVVFVAHQETFLAFGCSFQLFGCVDDGCPLADCRSGVLTQGEELRRAACLVDMLHRFDMQGEELRRAACLVDRLHRFDMQGEGLFNCQQSLRTCSLS